MLLNSYFLINLLTYIALSKLHKNEQIIIVIYEETKTCISQISQLLELNM